MGFLLAVMAGVCKRGKEVAGIGEEVRVKAGVIRFLQHGLDRLDDGNDDVVFVHKHLHGFEYCMVCS